MALPILRTPVLTFLVGGALSVWAYHTLTDNSVLQQRISDLEQKNRSLKNRIEFLRDRERVARVHVIDQKFDQNAAS
ncbi:MAG: hypothetical protein MK209_09150 [Planctomycetes bacterium]|nr:hypothetical protein [Planctomycetota bacterium]